MLSHKVLKQIVRRFVESFASAENLNEDEYTMTHIVKSSWKTGATELRVNILTGQPTSSLLLTQPVINSIKNYVEDFRNLVTLSHSSLEFITFAELIITVDPTIKRASNIPGYLESPSTSTFSIMDDRGKIYSYTIDNWWIIKVD